MSLLGYSVLCSQTSISSLLLLVEAKLQDQKQYYFDLDYFNLHWEASYLQDKYDASTIVYLLNRHFDSKQLNYKAELVYYLPVGVFYLPQWKCQIKVYKLNY